MPDNPGDLHVIIESFKHSAQEIYVEVKGVYAQQQINLEQPDDAIANLKRVRQFITERIYPFLNQFESGEE